MGEELQELSGKCQWVHLLITTKPVLQELLKYLLKVEEKRS